MSSILTIANTLTCTTTLGPSEPGNDAKEGILDVLYSSKTGTTLNVLVSYQGDMWEKYYPLAEVPVL